MTAVHGPAVVAGQQPSRLSWPTTARAADRYAIALLLLAGAVLAAGIAAAKWLDGNLADP